MEGTPRLISSSIYNVKAYSRDSTRWTCPDAPEAMNALCLIPRIPPVVHSYMVDFGVCADSIRPNYRHCYVVPLGLNLVRLQCESNEALQESKTPRWVWKNSTLNCFTSCGPAQWLGPCSRRNVAGVSSQAFWLAHYGDLEIFPPIGPDGCLCINA